MVQHLAARVLPRPGRQATVVDPLWLLVELGLEERPNHFPQLVLPDPCQVFVASSDFAAGCEMPRQSASLNRTAGLKRNADHGAAISIRTG